MAKWSSWGALPEVFEGWREDWADVQSQVRQVLSTEEFNAAMNTTLNAHYTDPSIVREVWAGLGAAGFTGGPVLEPGCGSGTFIGLAPDGVQMVGVELDPMTAQIAAALYPSAQVRVEGFQTSRFEGQFNAVVGNVPFGGFSLYDPMDNPRGLSIHNHFIVKSLKATAPGGYVAVLTSSFTMDAKRSTARMEMARYGDLVGAVRLPTGAFERVSGTEVVTDLLVFRRREDDQDVDPTTLGWINTTDVEIEPGRGVDAGEDVTATVNQYWVDRPGQVLGQLRLGQGMYGSATIEVAPDTSSDLASQVRDALGVVIESGRAQGLTYGPVPLEPAPAAMTQSGVRYPVPLSQQVQSGHVREANTAGKFETWDGTTWRQVKVPANQVGQTRSLLGLRDAATAVIDSQRGHATDQERAAAREQLHNAYDTYVGTFGPVNRFEWSTPRQVPQARIDKDRVARTKAWRSALPDSVDAVSRGEAEPPMELVAEWETELSESAKRSKLQPHLRALRTDPQFALVLALERFDENTGRARKAQIFDVDVVGRARVRAHAQTPADALAISLDETRTVDLVRIASLLGTTQDLAREQLDTLVFEDPATGVLEPAARYLSGNVRAKHAAAAAAASTDAKYAVNVAALGEVLPATVGIDDIVIRPGVRYLVADDYALFIRQTFKLDVDVAYNTYDSKWDLDGPSRSAYPDDVKYNFGVDKRSPADLLESMMNNAPVTITKRIDVDGIERSVRDVQATTLAREKCEAIQRAFSQWIVADRDRAGRIEAEYNARFNSHVSPDYSAQGQALALDGLSPNFIPHAYQREATARIVNEPTVLLDHVVGAGKTGTMIMGAMELRRTGIARKPWLVVPNHLVEQIAAEWKAWYPAANVMAIPSGCTAAERREWVARSAASDWDGVVVPASVFKLINIDPARSAQWLTQDLEVLRADLANASTTRKGADAPRAKKIAKQITVLEKRYAHAFAVKDPGLTFESSGCDYLFIDEAHHYKNLMRVSGHAELACTGSDQALDLDHKLRALREFKEEAAEREQSMSDGFLPAVATFATGTPVANSLSEMWVMQHYLRPDMLEAAGVETVDAWAGQFTQNVTKLEIGPDGSTWRLKDRIAAFQNAPELLAMTQQFASVVTREDITATLPALDGGVRRLVSRPASEHVVDYVKELADRANNLPKDPAQDNLLKITNDGRMVALDPRMMGLTKDPDGGRIGDVASNIMAIDAQYATTTYTDALGEPSPTPGGLQLVFADRGIPNADRRFSAYEALRDELVERGMGRSKIRFIHEATDDNQRAELFEACRDGRVSVLIGSTDKMGTGVNVQARATALHHMDCPYRPADLEQREGRSIRQGNQNQQTHIFQYVTEGTYDAVMWQIVARKAAFISQVKTKRITGRVIEDLSDDMTISAAAASAVATGDPRIIERAEVIAKITSLETLEQGFLTEQGALLREDRAAAQELVDLTANLPHLTQLAEAYRSTTADAFNMSIGGRFYSRRTDGAAALLHALRTHLRHMDQDPALVVDLATVGNISLQARPTRQDRGVVVFVAGTDTAGSLILDTDLTGDALGLIRRLEGVAGSVQGNLDRARRRMTTLTTRRADLAQVTGETFTRGEELSGLRARLDELDAALEMATDPVADQEDPATPQRVDGQELARILPTVLRGDGLREGDVLSKVKGTGLWEVFIDDHGHKRARKAGTGPESESVNLPSYDDYTLVSRLSEHLSPAEAIAATDPTARRITHRFSVRPGQTVTGMGYLVNIDATGKRTVDTTVTQQLFQGEVIARPQRTGDEGYELNEVLLCEDSAGKQHQFAGHGDLFVHDNPTPEVADKPFTLTVAHLLPGDTLTSDLALSADVKIPAGAVITTGPGYLSGMRYYDPATGCVTGMGHIARYGINPSVIAGRDLTDAEAQALWPDVDLRNGVPVAQLRVGDVVNSRELHPKAAINADVVITEISRGGMCEMKYRPVDDPGYETTTAKRREDQIVPVYSRRYGALTDSEVRSLLNPHVRVVTLEELSPETSNVVFRGRLSSKYNDPVASVVGSLIQRIHNASTVIVRQVDGQVARLEGASQEGVIYPASASVPLIIDRSGHNFIEPARGAVVRNSESASAAEPRRTSVAGVNAQAEVRTATLGM